jgi:para-aminobenzoate synthetase component I
MPLHWERLGGVTSVNDTFASFFANQPGSFWLDRAENQEQPFSVMGAGRPLDLEYTEDLRSLREALQLFSPDKSWQAPELPFSWRPGLVGVLHYDGGATRPRRQGDFLLVDRAFVFSHLERAMYFIGDFESREEFEGWYHAALLRLALIGGDSAGFQLSHDAATAPELRAEVPRADYLSAIESARSLIASGEIYQLCLTNRLRGQFTGSPVSYYLRLRALHSAPYAGFLKTDEVSYCSISPERLLSVSGGRVVSTPIKGTRPRSENSEEDRSLLRELGENEKERAENLMIVDLVRNDLAAVCDPASVTVGALLETRSYSTVHQLVSEVSGELRAGKDGIDALRSVFPAGSMTGAPKRRAMQLIDALEASVRAGYAGGFGYLTADGAVDLGMVIRTAVFIGDSVEIGIGGGLTSGSDPHAEHAEIQLKAQALIGALGAAVHW